MTVGNWPLASGHQHVARGHVVSEVPRSQDVHFLSGNLWDHLRSLLKDLNVGYRWMHVTRNGYIYIYIWIYIYIYIYIYILPFFVSSLFLQTLAHFGDVHHYSCDLCETCQPECPNWYYPFCKWIQMVGKRIAFISPMLLEFPSQFQYFRAHPAQIVLIMVWLWILRAAVT